jgi:hypothetical protein
MARWAWLVVFVVGCSGSGASGDSATDDVPVASDGSADVQDGSGKDGATTDGADSADAPTDALPDGVCAEGEHACLDDAVVSVCVNGAFQFSATCEDGATCQDGRCTKPLACTPGASVSCDGFGTHWVCSADGTEVALLPCADGTLCAEGDCRVVSCTPGAGQCPTSASIRHCLPDGSGYGPAQDCAGGMSCVGGACVSLCEADLKQNTNTGCQYWSVDLDNDPTHNPAYPNQPTPEMFPHSVVISNPNDTDVTMTFSVVVACASDTFCAPSIQTCDGQPGTVCDKPGAAEYELAVGDPVVPAGQSREFTMPVMNVSGSVLAPKAVRVMASRPVVAYQFNPFDSENATSNDGSLLLPQNALGKVYYVVSLPSRGAVMGFPENNGFVAIVATAPNTTVKVTPPVRLIANPSHGVGLSPAPLLANQTYTFTLQLFDVLNLEQYAEGGIITPGTVPKDLTGTRVEADKPVAVFSGHQVAGVQEAMKLQFTTEWDSCCTEHLEEQLMPVETWGHEAFCVKSKPRGYEADRFVVVAGEAGVQLTTVPSIDGVDGETLAKAGDSLRVETQESFVLKATGKIQVVQFLMSAGQTQTIGSGVPTTGDPSMMLLPPSAQYRDAYVIRTADGYGTNWTTVIRPAGLPISADGALLPDGAFEPLGDGTWEYAYHEVSTGNHAFTASQPFGLMVYGYGGVTAYGYPGGMNLVQ